LRRLWQSAFLCLGMTTARFADAKDIVPNKASLYSRYTPDQSRFEFADRNGDGVLSDRQMWVVSNLYPESIRAGAGLVMNALDFARLDTALSGGTMLNTETIRAMWAPVRLLDGQVGECALGWRRWVEASTSLPATLAVRVSNMID